MFGLGYQELLLLLFLPLFILPFWRIFSKAGFPGWLGIGMLIPLANILLLYYLAFAEWPAYRELHSWKRDQATS